MFSGPGRVFTRTRCQIVNITACSNYKGWQVIIQHHDSVVTSADLGLALRCQYDLGNRTVTNGLDLEVRGEISPALVEQSTVASPRVAMSVTARGGGPVERAQVQRLRATIKYDFIYS